VLVDFSSAMLPASLNTVTWQKCHFQ